MSNNNTATTVEATTIEVETTTSDDNQTQRDMRDVMDSIGVAGAIGNAALDLLSKLYVAKTADDRKAIYGKTDKVTLSMAAGVASANWQLKSEPNGPVSKLMPELSREVSLAQIDKVDRTIVLEVARELARLSVRFTDEDLASYGDAGCFYAGTPLGVDFGLEVGIRTGDGAETQRSGLVLGLRLDHLTGAKPASRLNAPKMQG